MSVSKSNIGSKRSWYAVGEYPLVGAREAREIRDKMRRKLFDGQSPREKKTPIRKFEEMARKWLSVFGPAWAEGTRHRLVRLLEIHVFPFIGDRAISELKPKDLLSIARRMEEGEIRTLSHVAIQTCSRIFKYAIVCEDCEYDPTQPIGGALAVAVPGHYASITKPAEVANLLRLIDTYPHIVVRRATQFLALTFLRPGEARRAEWTEIQDNEMHISSEKMKKRRPHVVPLSRQALEVLDAMRPLTGHSKYVFSCRSRPDGSNQAIGESTIWCALHYMGYATGQMTPHGFRHMASTLLNENGFNRDWIERQLAHTEGNSVRAAYNYAEYLPERRKMMQWWADYLDELRGSA